MFSKSPIYRKSNVQGILYTYYKAGNKVKKGDSLGHITNPFGLVIQEIRASPFRHYSLYERTKLPQTLMTHILA